MVAYSAQRVALLARALGFSLAAEGRCKEAVVGTPLRVPAKRSEVRAKRRKVVKGKKKG